MPETPSETSSSPPEGDAEGTPAPAGGGGESGGAHSEKVGTLRSLAIALSSWRTASVVLLSFSSGMPLGLVWIAIPDWMRSADVDIRIVGLFTLAQMPWTFNVLWAPLMDRFRLPFLGRRRGWAALAQLALGVGTLGLAGVGDRPEAPWVALALTLGVAFAAASQDIAIDAYAIDVLNKHEQGVAVGARIALYRAAMLVAGSWAITAAASVGWSWVCIGLGLLYLPMLLITVFAPEPPQRFEDPKTMKEAIWYPFIGFLSRHRALEILLFVLLFKAGDNFAQALLRPFLNDVGYTAVERGFALGNIGLIMTLAGALLGSIATNFIGLGPSLWIFGFLQMFSNLGYVLLANQPPSPWLMYTAMSFENLTQGLGTGAFSILLFRLTQKRFSATQYALFSTLFGLGRIVSGPVAGFTVDAVGWSNFFLVTIPLGLPGMIMLWRFVPWGVRDPQFEVRARENETSPPTISNSLSRSGLASAGFLVAGVAGALGAALVALLAALKALRADPDSGFDYLFHLRDLLTPTTIFDFLQLFSLFAFMAVCGLLGAAVTAARQGAGRDLETG
ncbi:MAG: MFS transporter [Acidobacteriota bacterium]